jgi:hypothetical protein
VQQVVALKSALQKPSQATVLAMKLSAERAGWHAVSHDLSNEPLCLEQEALDAKAPFLRSSQVAIRRDLCAPNEIGRFIAGAYWCTASLSEGHRPGRFV